MAPKLEPIRIFVGTTDDQMLSTKVLEYSIRQTASRPVEVAPLHLSGIHYPMPKDPKNRPRTPFSFQRFLIPELCGFRGKAIYVDSDMLVFDDIAQIFDLDISAHDIFTVKTGATFTRRKQFSVMLINCERVKWNIHEIVSKLDRGEIDYEELVYEMALAPRIEDRIPEGWNHLEKHVPGKTKLLHFTDMPTQPWVSTQNRLDHLWFEALYQAVSEGFVDRAFILDHVEKSWVRPSLVYQLDHRILEARDLPNEALARDRGFLAPYQRMSPAGSPTHGLYGRGLRWLKTRVEALSPR